MPTRAPLLLDRRHFLALGAGSLAAIGGAPLAATAQCQAQAEPWIPSDDFLAALPRLMAAFSVPGLGIAVIEGGKLVWSRTLGVTHALTQAPVTADTLFENASLSKPVFAYLVMQLSDQGLIDLDRPLVHYRRPDYLSDSPWIEQITARDVLRHSSGLPNWRTQPAQEKLTPAFKPGTRIGYSGEAFFWLQLVVETLTGESLDASMQARLFGPAGMTGSSYGWDADIAARSVYGHRAHDLPGTGMPQQLLREQWSAAQPLAERWGKPLSAWKYDDAVRALPEVLASAPPGLVQWQGDLIANAAASLRTTLRDYATFMTLMMPRTTRAAWEVKETTRQAMLSPQLVLPGRWTDKGLGWNLEDSRSGPVFYHAGSNADIFKNFALGDAARQRAIVLLTNGGSGNLLYRRIVRHASGHDLLGFDL